MSHSYMGSYGSGGFAAEQHAEDEAEPEDWLEHEDPHLTTAERENVPRWSNMAIKILKESDPKGWAMEMGEFAAELRLRGLRGPAIDAVIAHLERHGKAGQTEHRDRTYVQAYYQDAATTSNQQTNWNSASTAQTQSSYHAPSTSFNPVQQAYQPSYSYQPTTYQPVSQPAPQRHVGFEPARHAASNQGSAQHWSGTGAQGSNTQQQWGGSSSGQGSGGAWGSSSNAGRQGSSGYGGMGGSSSQYGRWA